MSAIIEDLTVKVSLPRRPKPVSVEALLDVQKARPVLEQIANKWSVLILTVLCTRPSRFNEIMRRLDGITPQGTRRRAEASRAQRSHST